MNNETLRARLLNVTALAQDYCLLLENVREVSRYEFVARMLNLLPRLYVEFLDIAPESSSLEEEEYFFQSYVDEDYYESVRLGLESIMGADDIFLETFEEDMKYSDSPIASSVSECLADIFQPLFNFLSVVKDTEGDNLVEAYLQCREDFDAYWSQTLCNVLRALNNLRNNITPENLNDDHDKDSY